MILEIHLHPFLSEQKCPRPEGGEAEKEEGPLAELEHRVEALIASGVAHNDSLLGQEGSAEKLAADELRVVALPGLGAVADLRHGRLVGLGGAPAQEG